MFIRNDSKAFTTKIMNKQKNRYTPFSGKYKMPVDEFCKIYGLNLKLVMHRMNTLYWEDFDSLVIPQELGSIPADKIRRVLEMQKNGWKTDMIQKRMKIEAKAIENIGSMDNYRKSIFLNMDNYFYLNPKKINLDKIFVPVKENVAIM